MKDNNEQLFCSFCGKPKELTKRLIAGPNGIYICDECIEVCRDVMKEDDQKQTTTEPVTLLKPVEIKAKLDEYIIGQDEAKKVLAVAVYNHYKRILQSGGKGKSSIFNNITVFFHKLTLSE